MRAAFRATAVLPSAVLVAGAAKPTLEDFPVMIDGGAWPAGHLQGIAVDTRNGLVYYSFTTMLVKTDFEGTVLGTVTGFTGHLGDLDFNEKDGRVYGSLEYKAAESFYIAIFDVGRITRVGMDAETDGIVSAVHLDEVVQDFTADMDGNGVFDGDIGDTPDHRYGCSGIDGVTFGPAFGRKTGKQLLTVAYGVYSNPGRADNDHQVLLQYDVSGWTTYERPLTQAAPHRSGPAGTDGKYFVHTGNTCFGVQNLNYDAFTHTWLLGVYPGAKPDFPNYSLFAIDGSSRPRRGEIVGQPAHEEGMLLPLVEQGLRHAPTGVRGWNVTADVGLESLGNGYFYIATQGRTERGGLTLQTAVLDLYRWTGATPSPFERVHR